MIAGYVTFWYEGGEKDLIKFGSNFRGIKKRGARPTAYTITVGEGSLDLVEAKRLTEWLSDVRLALAIPR